MTGIMPGFPPAIGTKARNGSRRDQDADDASAQPVIQPRRWDGPVPESVPIAGQYAPVRKRAAFSSGAIAVSRQYADGPLGIRAQNATRRRRLAADSLRLIDDLTNRPMDSLYADALLDQRPRSAFTIWATRIVVFVICVAVGISGSIVVQRLHADPQRQQRDWYISRIEEVSAQSDQLTRDVADLRSQVSALSGQLGASSGDQTLTQDEMMLGSVAVTGPGITVTLVNPLSANSSDDNSSSNGQLRVVTDGDLQWYVSQLWSAGAEAIAVNQCRLGVQSAIRKAGGTILVDLTKIESPYVIEAIGDQSALRAAVNATGGDSHNDALEQAGIFPKISSSKAITLKAAEPKNLSYARSVE